MCQRTEVHRWSSRQGASNVVAVHVDSSVESHFLLSRCPASLWALSVHASHLAAFRFPHHSHQTSLDVCLYSHQDKWMQCGKLYLWALPCLSLLHLLLGRAGLACCPFLCRSWMECHSNLVAFLQLVRRFPMWVPPEQDVHVEFWD